ncbi:hypothetical protein [Pediococcus acidilactici]|uniref:hypothetical protein n=1 Tax=Pediococcus acidilactici TaxID=1254 RepID=UPI001BD54970|nr:hypothetical protein [Pediococcus acidilactici]MBS9400112.1 hypothetical protein [Pediococcus acidilactici]
MLTIDLTGKHFGHLIVVKRVPNRTKDNHSMWLCQCDCGKQIEATSTHLTSGHTVSCGHVKADVNHNIRPGYEKRKVNGVATFLLSNSRKIRYDNKTGVTGVKIRTLKDGTIRYVAQIDVNGKRYHLGTFPTLESARQAREKAKRKLLLNVKK